MGPPGPWGCERALKEGAYWQSPEGDRQTDSSRWWQGSGEVEGQRKGTRRQGTTFGVVGGEVP